MSETRDLPVSGRLAAWIEGLEPQALPAPVVEMCRRLVIDVAGLCLAARREEYVRATLASRSGDGACTVLGHDGGFTPYDAALVNGTAAHGEDFDDTFEGGPVHSGAVVLPAVLALAQARDRGGPALLRGLVVGVELLCRLSLVAPKAIHKAGFHPTAVLGALATAAAGAATLGLDRSRTAHALGIAGSTASGIIEYLGDGSWTKRMHAGWAAQGGIRAALMAEGGFIGPRSVLEGSHGFFKAFAPSRAPDFDVLLDRLGAYWQLETLAFKPYACGTMTQPYIDCAIELARRGVSADDIVGLECAVGEGTVHRLWEPLELKRRPPTAYAAKFSTPFCIAIGFLTGKAGLAQFSEETVRDERVLRLAARVGYFVDPDNEYPRNYTGHVRATLADGRVIELRQPHMRGGAREPLSRAEVERKFRDNAAFGGVGEAAAVRLLGTLDGLFEQPRIGGAEGWAV
ncbi:MAG TPA: MmgE/PrpD family protein [Geminicoccaceae bacterium]|nr:MmgE/PrpD family protein [Geminicoccaceae bacterium]